MSWVVAQITGELLSVVLLLSVVVAKVFSDPRAPHIHSFLKRMQKSRDMTMMPASMSMNF